MENIFITLLNRSIAAGWLILAVILLRQLLRKAPRWIVCALWALVAVRLVCPFSIQSVLSLIPSAETFDAYNVQYETPEVETGISGVNHAVNSALGSTFAPAADTSVNPLYVWMYVAGIVWAVGVAALLLYAAVSSALLRRRVREAARLRDNIWVGDAVQSPFILGVARPRIYLPSGMDAQYLEPVIAHERAHLARHDHWWKPLGFALFAVYWFNPLCWAAYLLLCRDIELACDEKVIREMELAARKDYSYALVACGARDRRVLACPLAFGEVGVKERVRKVLNYKRPTFWIVVAAVAACVVAAVCFLTDPETEEAEISDTEAFLENFSENYPDYTILDYCIGSEENAPIQLAAIAKNQNTGNSSTIFLLTDWGTAEQAWLENEGQTWLYRAEDGLSLEQNTAVFSLDVCTEDGTWEIHDVRFTLTKNQDGYRVYKNQETVREVPAASEETATEEEIQTGTAEQADALTAEQIAIRNAIIEHNQSGNPQEYDIACVSFVTLSEAITDSTDVMTGETMTVVTYYGWALYKEFNVSEAGLEEVSGSHVPVVLTFHVVTPSAQVDDLVIRSGNEEYTLEEYWEPGDGSYYVPAIIVEEVLDSQKYIYPQMMECYAQAVEATGLDTSVAIGKLLERIMSSPMESSSAADYIDAHSTQYRELLYYGAYTLQYYCDLLDAGEADSLEAQILKQACGEIVEDMGTVGSTLQVSCGGNTFTISTDTDQLEAMKQMIAAGKYYEYNDLYAVITLPSEDSLYAVDSDNRGLINQYIAVIGSYALQITTDTDIAKQNFSDAYFAEFYTEIEPIVSLIPQYARQVSVPADEPAPDGVYVYDSDQGKLSIARYNEFTYTTEDYSASAAESEGSPDWGIRVALSETEWLYFYQCVSPSLNWSDYEDKAQDCELVTAGDYTLGVVTLADKVVGYSSMGGSYQGIYFEVSQETWAEKSDVILAIVGSATVE